MQAARLSRNLCSARVRLWPVATDRILVADRRFRSITDLAGAAAGGSPDANDPGCVKTRCFMRFWR
jgi:hypothetical protein